MRMKFVRNSRTNRRELVIASQRGETLAGKLADRLVDDPSALLLGFAYEKQRSGGALLHYDVDGLWSLRTYLAKRALGLDEVRGLLEATQGVLDLCAEQHLRTEGLLFDPEFVFVDAQCCPHFALVPLEDMPFEARNSPLALLTPLGDTDKLRFASPDAEGLARRLGDLVLDLEGVFSANRFRRFVEDEQRQGEGAVPEARRSVVDPSTSSVWATAGATSEQSPADSSSLFWSPLAGFAEEGPQVAAPVTPAAPVAEPVPAVATTAQPVAPVSEPIPACSPAVSHLETASAIATTAPPVAPVSEPVSANSMATPVAPSAAAPVASAAPAPAPAVPPVVPAAVPATASPVAAYAAPEAYAAHQMPSSGPLDARAAVRDVAYAAPQAPLPGASRSTREPQAGAVPVAPVAEPASATVPANGAPSWPASASNPRMASAVLVRPMTGERFALPAGTEVVAGRGSSCAIRLRGNPKISRTHVALTWTGQVLVVRDLGAVNGVWVDGYRLTPQQPVTMMPGQRLRLADEEFEIRNVW